jgi:hypothetical protein
MFFGDVTRDAKHFVFGISLIILCFYSYHYNTQHPTYSYATYQTNTFKDIPSKNIYTVRVVRKEIKNDMDVYTHYILIDSDEVCLGIFDPGFGSNIWDTLVWEKMEEKGKQTNGFI